MAGTDLHENLLADFADWPYSVARAECDGNGWVELVFTDKELVHRATRCPRCARRKLQAAIASFTPPRFRQPVEVPDAISQWAARGRKAEGLYLAGQVGTGKTHAAWMAVSAWCLATGVTPTHRTPEDFWSEHGGAPSVVFSRLTDLLDDFRPGDDSVQHVRDCQVASLLVIDDMGAEKASEWTQERLYSVVDHRYANCLPLIVTGNLPPARLAEQTGDRVASRLAQMCTVVPMTGTDRRRSA